MNSPIQFFEHLVRITDEPILLVATSSPVINSQAYVVDYSPSLLTAYSFVEKITEITRLGDLLHQDINYDVSWKNHRFEVQKLWLGNLKLRVTNDPVANIYTKISRIGYAEGYYYYVLCLAGAPALAMPKEISDDNSQGRLDAVIKHVPSGIFRVRVEKGPEFYYIGANLKHEEMAGQPSSEIKDKKPEDIMSAKHAEAVRYYYLKCYEAKKPIVYEIFLDLPSGGKWWQSTLVPLLDADGEVVELIGVSSDITDRKHTAQALANKIDQQAAIAELGQLALTQLELPVMLSKATEIIARALEIDFCKVQEYSSNEQILTLTAGVGWNPGLVGSHVSSVWENTHAAATLKSLHPIVVENFDTDGRYEPSVLLKEHNIKSGLAVVISGLSGPYGILSVHSTETRAFNDDQIYFLQVAADTLANAIKNYQTEEALRESERLVSSILESAQIGIGVSDESGRFVRVNKAFCQIYGYEGRDLLGREFTVLLPISEHQRARQIYAHFLKTGQESPGEGTGIRKDGRPIDVQITAGRLQRADGSMLRVTTVEDITRRKSIEANLKLFQLAALNSHDGIIITEAGPIDTPGPRIIFCNSAINTISGYDSAEVLGKTLLMFEGRDTEPLHSQAIRTAMRSRRPADVEIKLHRKDNTSYWAAIGIVPVNDSQGRHMNWLITMRDITEAKNREAGLYQAKEMADTASKAKSDFLAGVSHEIRTPLNAIIGFADVLRRELFGPLGHERYVSYATDIHESGRHLLQLINNTLDLSKIEAGVLDMHESNIPVEATIRSCIALMKDNAQNAKLKLTADIEPNLPLLHADETKVKQILLNMLSNAVKYTLPGGEITARAKMAPRGLVLEVSDTGVGISEEDIPRVMQKYMQAASEQNKYTQGTGLGIPVIKSLIELHGGTLELTSKIGVGTTITAIFPHERIIANIPQEPKKAKKAVS